MRTSSIVVLLAVGCVVAHATSPDADARPVEPAEAPTFEPAPAPSPELRGPELPDLAKRIDGWFEGWGTRRLHVQLDRLLYRPGEAVWVKSWSLVTRGLTPQPGSATIRYELVDPRGQVVEAKDVLQQGGTATNDFVIAPDAPGGKWTLRATLPSGEVDERPFVVASYQAPRIRKDLEFVREAYGPGDRVEALVEMERGTGGPLAGHPVRALLQIAGETVLDTELTTDRAGAVFVAADLPRTLSSADGLLTVIVEDGGVTESISRTVPIVLADVSLAFFPEGGDLVAGIPGRVYLEATDRFGEPADVEGYVTDDRGERVATFASVHDGLGRLAFTPARGRTYTAHVTAPAGVTETWTLPDARPSGCTVRSFDDFESRHEAVRVAVRCSKRQDVLVVGALREQVLDAAAVAAGPEGDTVVYLMPDEAMADQQGAVRVTVFDAGRNAVAERLVYRNRGRDLQIAVAPDRARYGPRDEVVLKVRTTDPSGDPVAAELALSVVDDAVVSLADDEEGHMLTRLYLEPELVDSPEDPGWYFDPDEPDGARGLDLVMGTKGYRRFEWHRVWDPGPRPTVATHFPDQRIVLFEEAVELAAVDEVALRPRVRAPRFAHPPMAPQAAPVDVPEVEPAARAVEAAGAVRRDLPKQKADDRRRPHGGRPIEKERDVGGLLEADELLDAHDLDQGFLHAFGRQGGWATVRVFPKPDYREGFTGIRTDFRDTVLWEPTVQTDKDGTAEVRFYLSDAVTTFRATAEGIGGGRAGRAEATFASVLPVHVETTLPQQLSAGDRVLLPVTVRSNAERPLDVAVRGEVDATLLTASDASGALSLAPGGAATHWIALDVGSGAETATVRLSAEGGGLSDTIELPLQVVPPGFPRSWSAAGESDGAREFVVHVDEVVEGSLTASVTWHPSTVATLISGMEGLIREPGGCFEQTSSTNWPNVAILDYLEAHDGDPRLRMESSRALQVGYDKLTGYQVDAGGFETWGSGPGKEALSAFGLLQFRDMREVFPVDDAVLTRNVRYLLGQRDGSGGFQRTGESAHGYGSAPAEVLDGFITYALVATGYTDGLDREIARQAEAAERSNDPYVLAMAARTLALTKHARADRAMRRLAALQAEDGSFPGAESSITRSHEANLLVESTALAALALMEVEGYRSAADRAAKWLTDNRQGAGTWGATQATALALSALTRHAELHKRPRVGGRMRVDVNGRTVGTLDYTADETGPLVIEGWEEALRPGPNVVVLRQERGEALPFTVDVAWTSLAPTSARGAELSLTTRLDRAEVAMGETVRLTATVENETDAVVPSPIARIGIPAGLEPQPKQLEELQERGIVAFFETRPREVTLYWDGIHADARHEVALDLVARVPGTYTAPASSAYPYYDDDEKAWAGGLTVGIDRPR